MDVLVRRPNSVHEATQRLHRTLFADSMNQQNS
jgi:hypothetical protein